jgi:hypothetical protein
MSLQDHFKPPLSVRRHWHAFHNAWATYIASDLNRKLPEGYFAEPNVQFGIEIDVATFEESSLQEKNVAPFAPKNNRKRWKPPAPTQSVPFEIASDTVEIALYNNEAGPVLTAAIELISPANKDRPSARKAFVSKCETYLQQGIGLVIVDIVTERSANLHNELLVRLGASKQPQMNAELYAVAYHTVERGGQTSLDIWEESLSVGNSLPTMPLWLRGSICLPLELETTYQRTCREQRITANVA